MSPRPRTVPDEEILAGAHLAMSRSGPSRFTLAEVAEEVGLAPATLVQRFGSKRGLLLAVMKAGADGVDACFEAVRERHDSPLEALLDAATDMARMMKTPEEAVNALAMLQIDLSDPEFRALTLGMSKKTLAGYHALLEEAVADGELRPCDTRGLARVIAALAGGSLISWAVHRKGTAERWVRRDVESLLEPYRA